MTRNKLAVVECYRNETLIARYEFLIPATLGSPPVIDRANLVEEAKNNLVQEGKTTFPVQGIEFKIS